MINPYIVCTWALLLSILYPLHGISTFPINILCLFGLFGKSLTEVSYQSAYNYFMHLGPFFWVPWTFQIESIILCLFFFFIYTTLMIILFKNPLDYYLDLEQRKDRKELYVKAYKIFGFNRTLK
jgi:hypothetical protein